MKKGIVVMSSVAEAKAALRELSNMQLPKEFGGNRLTVIAYDRNRSQKEVARREKDRIEPRDHYARMIKFRDVPEIVTDDMIRQEFGRFGTVTGLRRKGSRGSIQMDTAEHATEAFKKLDNRDFPKEFPSRGYWKLE